MTEYRRGWEAGHAVHTCTCGDPSAEPQIYSEPDRQAAYKAGWDDAKAVISEVIVKVGPHPGEHHDFRTTCLKCGENGMLHIAVITADENVVVTPWVET